MSDIVASFGWPQWIWLAFNFIGLAIVAHEHGNPKKGTYNFPLAVMGSILNLFVLSIGGFFK
jgi:hypothetical protein